MEDLFASVSGITPSAIYYFFSSAAQGIAAIVGLSAALAIFRYQGLLQRINDAAEVLVRYFASLDLAPYWPWDMLDGSAKGLQRYRESTTANGHLNILRPYLDEASKTEGRLKANLETVFKTAPKDAATRLGSFRNLKASFDKYDVMVVQAGRLRRLTIFTTTYGLTLVLLSLALVLSPDVPAFKPDVVVWLLFGAAVAIYFGFTVLLTVIAFADPQRDK